MNLAYPILRVTTIGDKSVSRPLRQVNRSASAIKQCPLHSDRQPSHSQFEYACFDAAEVRVCCASVAGRAGHSMTRKADQAQQANK